MRVVIDLQGAQTESRFRGIGRYSLSLAVAMARQAGPNDVWLILNSALGHSIEPIRRAFDGLVAPSRIRVFDVPGPVAQEIPAHVARARAAEKIREYAIAQLKPDVVLLTSLFEGYIDDGVTSVDAFMGGERTAVVLYDLIPLLNPADYLHTAAERAYYDGKISALKRAGLLLAISDHSRQEAIDALGLAPRFVATISSAADERFTPGAAWPDELLTRLGIARKMVMAAPGGLDPRKNVDGLIAAYALLPRDLRAAHQLVVVSRISDAQRERMIDAARQFGLGADELIFTGYVDDDKLVALYRAACLFVMPSRHEGFGLPALEAMACGAPVIASNVSSLPEVIGRSDALFDPDSLPSMAQKMEQVLRDDSFRLRLRNHAPVQAARFSWDRTAALAWQAIEDRFGHNGRQAPGVEPLAKPDGRPRLAFVSPLPPARTGIANYSAELLPALMAHFEIELVTDSPNVSLPPALAQLPVRGVAWFERNARHFDRIVYQFGNSPFHSHMLALLRRHPGIVVMHDFFMSGMLAHDELSGTEPGVWTRALYESHGYPAMKQRHAPDGIESAKLFFPCNLELLEGARGVIVHSAHAVGLARAWYGEGTGDDWHLIPHLRVAVDRPDPHAARRVLGIPEDAFLICSFGFVDPSKLSLRLLNAWLASRLRADARCHLILVGANHGGDYGAQLSARIAASGLSGRIHITGWADDEKYRLHLQAADLAVQLRTQSRGETSGAVLDCMNHGLPVIVNANGAMADLPDTAVRKLPDDFSDAELIDALEDLWRHATQRQALGEAARSTIAKDHNPAACAAQYACAIAAAYRHDDVGQPALLRALAGAPGGPGGGAELENLAQCIGNATPRKTGVRQLLVDVSAIARNDLRTGIERVVRTQLLELFRQSAPGWRVEPVRLSNEGGAWHYRYAQRYAASLLGMPASTLRDVLDEAPVDVANGDVFYSPDFNPGGVIEAAASGLYADWRARGVALSFLVYDLLPIQQPAFFPEGADQVHSQWLDRVAAVSDQLLCISHAVAEEVRQALNPTGEPLARRVAVHGVPLGADIACSAPSAGLPADAAQTLARLAQAPSFLMVGTIEPRKGHLQALVAFERLWREGCQANLVIVGREGWTQLPRSQRRTIPAIVDRLKRHPERGRRLFWLDDVSDEYLEAIYAASDCLLAPSEGEGFGLPLIEAARYGLPVIARDLPVFREVAGDAGCYFRGLDDQDIATAVRQWLERTGGARPAPGPMPRSWEQNVRELLGWLTGAGAPGAGHPAPASIAPSR